MGFFDFLKKKTNNLQSKDALVIYQLKEHGSRLSQPHNIDFFFYVPNQQAAQKCAERLEQDGFTTQVSEPLDDGWGTEIVT